VNCSECPRSEIPADKTLFLTIETTSCAGTDTEVNFLEHVQAVITVNATRYVAPEGNFSYSREDLSPNFGFRMQHKKVLPGIFVNVSPPC
jgi:hypothetical protein